MICVRHLSQTKASGNCSVLASWRVYNGFIMSQGFRCCKIAPSQNSSRLLHVNLVNWNCKWGKVLPVTEIKPDRRGKWSVLKTILKICGSWSSFMLPPDLSSWVLDMISCWSQGYWKKGMLVFIVMFRLLFHVAVTRLLWEFKRFRWLN